MQPRRLRQLAAPAALVSCLVLGLTACDPKAVPALAGIRDHAAPRQRRPATTTSTTPPTTAPPTTAAPTTAPPSTAPATTVAPTTATTALVPTTTPPTTAAAGSQLSSGWEITVYVTPVERYYSGPTTAVSGCPTIECGRRTPKVDLGSYPAAFVSRVHDEGTGLITSGANAGRYLDWSYDTGYWLDTAPRDSWGNALVPFVSAAADGLARGTRVRITTCGTDEGGDAPDPAVASALQGATWEIRDEFTPGLGGTNHIDLYLGLEDRVDFENTSPFWITYVGATLRVG